MKNFNIKLKNVKIADDSALESSIPDVIKKVNIKEEQSTENIENDEKDTQQIVQEKNEIDNENKLDLENEADSIEVKKSRLSFEYGGLILVLILFILLIVKIFYNNRKSEN